MYQKMQKEIYAAVRMIMKYLAEILSLHNVRVNVTSGKHFTVYKEVL